MNVPLETLKTVYVHVQNPDNHEQLLELKKVCGLYPGQNDVIMMLGESKTNAIRLPFRVDAGDTLRAELRRILGNECVAVK